MIVHVHHHIHLGGLSPGGTPQGELSPADHLALPWPFSILTDMLQRLQRIELALSVLNGRVLAMAGTLDSIKQSLDDTVATVGQLSTVLDGIGTDIQFLKDKIANGVAITQQDLDDMQAKADAGRQAALDALTKAQGMDDPAIP